MPKAQKLSHLECIAIAQVWRLAPCTAHDIRRSFANSSAGRYSDSAGSIYPLLKRLAKAGFVIAKEDWRGAQRRMLYRCSATGLRAVRAWLFDMEPKSIFPDDPLRTRLSYLDLLDTNDQQRWIADAQSASERQSRLTTEEYEDVAADDQINRLIIENLRAVARARADMLRKAATRRSRVGTLSVGGRDPRAIRPISGK